MPAIVVVLIGVVTATFGGALRDIVCNEIPSAFRDHRPYAVCAFSGSERRGPNRAKNVAP